MSRIRMNIRQNVLFWCTPCNNSHKKISSFQSYLSPFFTLSLFSLLCSISFFSLAYLSHSCLYPLPDQTFTLAQSSDRITNSQKGHCIGVYRVQCIVCIVCSVYSVVYSVQVGSRSRVLGTSSLSTQHLYMQLYCTI